jgi:hypothetical protein
MIKKWKKITALVIGSVCMMGLSVSFAAEPPQPMPMQMQQQCQDKNCKDMKCPQMNCKNPNCKDKNCQQHHPKKTDNQHDGHQVPAPKA